MRPTLTRRFRRAFADGLFSELRDKLIDTTAWLAGFAYLILQSGFSLSRLIQGKAEAVAVAISVLSILTIYHAFGSARAVVKEIREENARLEGQHSELFSASGERIPIPVSSPYSYYRLKLYATAVCLTILMIAASCVAWQAIPIPEAPDLVVMVVNPTTPGLILFPVHATARDVRSDPVLWDLDREDKSIDSLYVSEAKYDWIRTDQRGGPSAMIDSRQLNSVVKEGHRIFGYITTACPDCEHIKLQWVYFVYGKGGWYSEIMTRISPDPKKISDAIPSMRQGNLDDYLKFIPDSARIPIRELR